MHSFVSDFTLTYNKASPACANDTNNVMLNKDSSFSDDSSAASQFQVWVSPVLGAIGSANPLEL